MKTNIDSIKTDRRINSGHRTDGFRRVGIPRAGFLSMRCVNIVNINEFATRELSVSKNRIRAIQGGEVMYACRERKRNLLEIVLGSGKRADSRFFRPDTIDRRQ